MNGYNFTDQVRKSLQRAREEAARLHHEHVGTEHLLLGLLKDQFVASTLTNLGTGSEEVRRRVESSVKEGSAIILGPDFPYTAPAKKVLELAMSEARELNHSYVGTEHLLLGLLREGKGIAAQVLTEAGVRLDRARAETVRLLGSQASPSTAAPVSSGRFMAISGRFVAIPGTHVVIFGFVAVALVAWLVSGPAVLAAIVASLLPLFLVPRYWSFLAAQLSVLAAVGLGALVGSFLLGSGTIGMKILATILAGFAVAPPVAVLFTLRWGGVHGRPRRAA